MKENKYHQIRDVFKYLKNPSKYIGTRPITTRSSWEFKLIIKYLDVSPNVIYWKSENTIIKYLNPLDKKYHRYFVDFTIITKDKDGNFQELWVEVKPYKETLVPKVPKRKTRYFLTEVQTYYVNNAKWETAKKLAEEKRKNGENVNFVVLTEKDCPFFLEN